MFLNLLYRASHAVASEVERGFSPASKRPPQSGLLSAEGPSVGAAEATYISPLLFAAACSLSNPHTRQRSLKAHLRACQINLPSCLRAPLRPYRKQHASKRRLRSAEDRSAALSEVEWAF